MYARLVIHCCCEANPSISNSLAGGIPSSPKMQIRLCVVHGVCAVCCNEEGKRVYRVLFPFRIDQLIKRSIVFLLP